MLSFNEIYEKYILYVVLKKKPQSQRSIKSRFKNYILPYIGNKNIFDFTPFDYLEWQKIIDGLGFKYKYKKALHYSVVALYNFCINFCQIDVKNVPSLVGNFKNNYDLPNKMQFYTYEEFTKFISVADDIIYHALFNFLFFSGCRIGEALALTFSDINENQVYINKTISKEYVNGKRVITTPKTKKSIRTILIDDYLGSELSKLIEHYNTKFGHFNSNFYIFGGAKPLSQTTVTRYKNKYCDLANLKRIRLHDFRHSYATLLVNLNIPIETVSEQLGHADVSTTYNIYVHNNLENKKRLVKSLNQLRTN